jgi:hypothetical protein
MLLNAFSIPEYLYDNHRYDKENNRGQTPIIEGLANVSSGHEKETGSIESDPIDLCG